MSDSIGFTWGGVSRSEGNIDPTHKFTGKELDPETGLYYYGGRYYDPEISRFISPDPFVPSAGNPQSLNRYSYVLNNPQGYIDPSGHFYMSKSGGGGGILQSVFGMIIGGIVAIVSGGAGVPAVLAGAMGGFTAAAVSMAGRSGVNPLSGLLGGTFLGGLAGAIGPGIFGALGGNPALGFAAANFLPAVGSGAITGAIVGAVSTGIYGGNFGRNLGFGALGGAGMAAIVYGVGAAWERYWYGRDKTGTPIAQEALQKYQARFPKDDISNLRIFEGGAGLSGREGALALRSGKIVFEEGILEGDREAVIKLFGHEFDHIALERAWPNYSAAYQSFDDSFGYHGNPLEWIAEHRGSVFASEVLGYPVPMNPFYTHP